MTKHNNKGENIKAASPDLSEALAYVYINPGPFMDDIDKEKMFDIVDTGEPNNVIGMEIHSSIDSLYRYGYVVIQDRKGFRETLSLTGNEIITLRYGNGLFVNNRPPKTIHFNIYDMEEVSISDNYRDRYTNRAIKIHLIEAPMFLLYNWKYWNRGFGKDFGNGTQDRVSINEIFRTHLETDLQITKGDLVELDVRDMSTSMYLNIPSWKPQMTFLYLLNFAKDVNGQSDVKFFPTTNLDSNTTILNLKSIYQMFQDEDTFDQYTTVNIGPMSQSASNIGESVAKTLNQIINYHFESYDITSLISGLAGSYTYNRSYIDGRTFVQTEDYRTATQKQKFFGNFGLWSDKIAEWNSMSFPIGNWPTDIASAYIENQMSRHRYQIKCISESYLNHNRNCGDKVMMLFPSGASAVDKNRTIDEQMSGEWLIQSMVDRIVSNRGSSNITFIKDSFFNTVASTQNKGGNQKLPRVDKITSQDNIKSVTDT